MLSQVAPAPESVLQLVRCNCGATNMESTNKCSRRCSCKSNNLVCTELCKCEADDESCSNTQPIVLEDDPDDD